MGISSESEYNSLINTDRHRDAIDIYFLSPTDSYARASGISGDALAFGGNYAETSVLSHEIGHCLGLYHTHSGSGCYDDANCVENIDGSNCSTCGDLVCDTPADPCLSGKVDNSCNYTGGGGYSPDTDNIMSYAPPTCLDDLTNGQMSRLHNIITNSSILQALSYILEISGTGTVCTSNSTFTLQNRPPNTTITWTKSSNLTYASGQGTNNYTVRATGNGNGWVQANVNGATFRKTVWVGVKADITGSSYVSYLGSGNWYANSSCANKYNWYLKKEDWGGYVSIQNSSSNQLTLNSVLSRSKRPAPLPGEETIYYLFVRASSGSGNYYQSTSKRIVAKGNDDLVVGNGGGLPPFELKISPNPANNIITLDIDNKTERNNPNIEYTVRLLDKYQKNVYQRNIKNNQITINVSNFQTGIYYLQVINGSPSKNSKKIKILIKKKQF